MCNIRTTKGEDFISTDGRTVSTWYFSAEVVAYQLVCATGFIVNALVLLVLSIPRPSVHLHPSSTPFITPTLYRLVSAILLLILPLAAARNVLENYEILSFRPVGSCVLNEVSHLLSEFQVPLENFLLVLFVFLVADRYVTLYKPFQKPVLFRQLRSVYIAIALTASGLLLLNAYPIYSRASTLLQTNSDTLMPQLELEIMGKNGTNMTKNKMQSSEIVKNLTPTKMERLWWIIFSIFMLIQVFLSIAVVILPFAM